MDDIGSGLWRCTACGTVTDTQVINYTDAGDWRMIDGRWEHACPDRAHPQVGHMPAERITVAEIARLQAEVDLTKLHLEGEKTEVDRLQAKVEELRGALRDVIPWAKEGLPPMLKKRVRGLLEDKP